MALLLALLPGTAVAAGPTPNFVFVLGDDWGYGDTSVYNTLLQQGIDQPATPRLAKMAAEGTVRQRRSSNHRKRACFRGTFARRHPFHCELRRSLA